MRFSQEFIERVADSSNIVDLISTYTQLKPSGAGLMGRCPFPDHPEKTPSFSVSPQKQVYYCFGCHKKGNIFTFLQEYSGMSFPEAIEYLADRANIQLPKEESSKAEVDQGKYRKKQLIQATQIASRYYQEQLILVSADHPVRQYIKKRKILPQIVDEFQLGYAPAEWDALGSYLQDKGVSEEISIDARLLKQRPGGANGSYDVFRDRLMFPIHNHAGEVVAFGGRVITSGEPKYLNSPESSIFSKGRLFYGMHLTARHIRAQDQALVVEGYMDLISLYQSGLMNVVASMGTALTLEQATLVRRYTPSVVALFDGDSAGMDAAERSLPIFLQAGCLPRGIFLPEGMDPDDFIQAQGAAALRGLIEQAPDLFELILGRWMKDYRGEATEKVQIMDRVRPILSATRDGRLVGLYVESLAKKLGASVSWVRSSLALNRQQVVSEKIEVPHGRPVNDGGEAIISLADASKVELLLLSLAVKSRANYEYFLQCKGEADLVSSGVKEIFSLARISYGQNAEKFDKFFSLLLSKVDDPAKLFVSEEMVAASDFGQGQGVSPGISEVETRYMQDCLKKIRIEKIRSEARHLSRNLSASRDSSQLEKIVKLHKKRLSIKSDDTDDTI